MFSKYIFKDRNMPFITYEAVKITDENKKKLIASLTETASKITSIPESSFTVLLKENPVDNWGIGGTPLGQILKNK